MQPQDFATVCAAVVTAIGVVVAVVQLRHGALVQKSQFIAQVVSSLFEDEDLRSFFYRVDYGQFAFDPEDLASFKGSKEERLLDTLLFKLNFVAGLVRRKVLTVSDVEFIMFEMVQVFSNSAVATYVGWLDAEYAKHGRHGGSLRRRPHDDARWLLESVRTQIGSV